MRDATCIQPANNNALISNEGAARLTQSNTLLLGLGVIFLVVAAIVVVIVVAIILMTTKGGPTTWLTDNKKILSTCKLIVKILLCGCFLLTLVSVVLWVAVGFHVGLQDSELM